MRLLCALLLLLPLAACNSVSDDDGRARLAAEAGTSSPAIRHVFVVNFENKDYDATWGPGSAAPYLSRVLRAQGILLEQFYGTAHHSLGNYLAQVSGQGPTRAVQRDCRVFRPMRARRVAAYQQRVGDGCVYGRRTPTLMRQLDRAGLRWRGYMQDMDRRCQHPRLGARDDAHRARPGHQYATRHNPFVYFRSVIDRGSYCRHRVVGLGQLTRDLAHVRTTRNLSYITPDLCNDGHDDPCVDGRTGGLSRFDRWLRRWIPVITSSPAFRRDGLLVITADEAEDDARGCCGAAPTPNVAQPGVTGPGGGRVGALVLSPYVEPGATSTRRYNQYGLLATIEKVFGLSRIGYARHPKVHAFGADVLPSQG